MEIFCGIPVSDGIAIAPARVINSSMVVVPKYYIASEKKDDELHRFRSAVERVKIDINIIKEQKKGSIAEDILDTYILILDDVEMHKKVASRIEYKLCNAEWAVQLVMKEYTDILDKSEEEYLRERVKDLHDMAIRIIEHLLMLGKNEIQTEKKESQQNKYILVAHTLFPSQFLQIPTEEIAGIILEQGGKTSHIVIIARAFGIPMVTGVLDAHNKISNHQKILLDGYKGSVTVHADEKTIGLYQKQYDEELISKEKLEQEAKLLVHQTKDNQSLSFNLNIDVVEELSESMAELSDGIGLFRTEFCIRDIASFKHSEKEQETLYSNLLKKMKGKPVTIRTLDLGGDKLPTMFHQMDEENPLLGYRGVRFSLGHKDLLMSQLNVLVKAAVHGNLKVMIPMVSTLEEFLEVKQLFVEIHKKIKEEVPNVPEHIDFGVMLEVPSLLYQLEDIAPHCDFWSIGTNDLLQYIMASDRTNSSTAYLYSYFQPAFLRVLRDIFYKGYDLSIPVYMCGEMAGDYNSIALLLGLGLRNFSVSPSKLYSTIAYATKLTVSDTRILVEKALQCQSIDAVRECVLEFNKNLT